MKKMERKKMRVEYPSTAEMRYQREKILSAVAPPKKRESFWGWCRNVFWGPGLRTIFYHSGMTGLILVLMYVALCAVFLFYSGNVIISVALFPLCFMVFCFLSCWLDEQEMVAELKNSMYYSLTYMMGLRMFYTSIGIILCNLATFAIIYRFIPAFDEKEVWKIGALGASSMFLFAIAVVSLSRVYEKSWYLAGLTGLWCVMAVYVYFVDNSFLRIFLLEKVPLVIHAVVAVGTFIVFVFYLGKVEKEYAYTFEGQ